MNVIIIHFEITFQANLFVPKLKNLLATYFITNYYTIMTNFKKFSFTKFKEYNLILN